ncbi:CHAT domain-containing protein [Synechocystis sp. LKSZ1]|uniref:CHAT domain-containing tetratricopeptide repeat protein n=1 Tax=Synechocystis sp. LKSZ1 TaxID=3144951 RepID=UPI00336BF3B2
MAKPRFLKYTLFLLGSLILSLSFGLRLPLQALNPAQLVQQGVEQYQQGHYTDAIQSWQGAVSQANSPDQLIILENLARAYQQVGQSQEALTHWQQVMAQAQTLNQPRKQAQALTEAAQVYLQMGQPRQALALLCALESEPVCPVDSALGLARQSQDHALEAAALGSRGEAYRLMGQYEKSIQSLEQALALGTAYQVPLQRSLGSAYQARGQRWQLRAESARQQSILRARNLQQRAVADYQKARDYFQASLPGPQSPTSELETRLDLMHLASQTEGLAVLSLVDSNAQRQRSLELLTQAPPTAATLFATIEMASLPALTSPVSEPLAQCPAQWQLPPTQRQALLEQGAKLASTLNNSRATAFALGALGHFYECQGDIAQAQTLTQQAILAAHQPLGGKDNAYLWEWQRGRLLLAQGQRGPALGAFHQAFLSLENIRRDLLNAEREVQLDFRQSIEPVYRQLVQLLLESGTEKTLALAQRQEMMHQALGVIDAFRIAELQNYLGNDCPLEREPATAFQPERLPNTVVINAMVFEKRTALLWAWPDGTVGLHWINKTQDQLRNTVKNLRQSLLEQRAGPYQNPWAQALYQDMIQPQQDELQRRQIKTLVFIQDGFFRTIPMTVLHDGQQFLVENYAVVTQPSLPGMTTLQAPVSAYQALILGVSEATTIDDQVFEPLVNVPLEVRSVAQRFGRTKTLVDQQFSPQVLNQELSNADYPIVHIATHAQFGLIAEDTFLITGNNQKMTLSELEESLRRLKNGGRSVELLFLAACQTAEGDDRSALGLAGAAVQVGVKGAIGSLWPVADESTFLLVTSFYENLVHNSMSKAEALRQTQIKMIHAKENTDINDLYANPYYWSPFILIGNWL